MSGGLIVDSVVGEKEKKTIEALLTLPIKREKIIQGKLLGVFSWITFQCFFWLLILRIFGIPFENFWGILLLLSLINLSILSTAFVIATYSSSVKEANISLMLFYVLAFISIIISLSLEFFNPRGFYDFIPFNIISSLSAGDPIRIMPVVFTIITLIGYSIAMMRVNSELFKRDDVIFGPAPSIPQLAGSCIDYILRRFETRPYIGKSIVSIISGIIALPISLIIQISLGISILYFLGYSSSTLVVMIAIFALLEEILKPMALFYARIERKRDLAIYGGIAGISFFTAESLLILISSSFSMPLWMLYRIFTLRMSSTLLIHIISSSMVGYGIYKGKKEFVIYLLLATYIHVAYNLVVLGVRL
jgi:hypothetical protein